MGRIINQLTIDKKIFWTSALAAQFPNSFICILDIIFIDHDPVKLKNNKGIANE